MVIKHFSNAIYLILLTLEGTWALRCDTKTKDSSQKATVSIEWGILWDISACSVSRIDSFDEVTAVKLSFFITGVTMLSKNSSKEFVKDYFYLT